jgi:hypothetical protein
MADSAEPLHDFGALLRFDGMENRFHVSIPALFNDR